MQKWALTHVAILTDDGKGLANDLSKIDLSLAILSPMLLVALRPLSKL